jgi:hypothetical protein
MASKPSRKELSALQKAQDIVYAAWEESSETRRLALAGKAVEVSPLCADAWSIIAGHAPPESDDPPSRHCYILLAMQASGARRCPAVCMLEISIPISLPS